jgi:fructose-bisphosphate aldolase, class I
MKIRELTDTANALVAGDKGLLAMDESNPTCNKRFAEWGTLNELCLIKK